MIGIKNAVRVSNTKFSNNILLSNGKIMLSGLYYDNIINNDIISKVPFLVPDLSNIVDIKSNAHATLALNNKGDLFFFDKTLKPIKLKIQNVVAISGCNDGNSFLILDSSNYCYSYFNNGIIIKEDSNVVDILCGETFSYIIKKDKSLWAKGTSVGKTITYNFNSIYPYTSIWMDISDTSRNKYTKLNPNKISLCQPKIAKFNVYINKKIALCEGDSIKIGNIYYKDDAFIIEDIINQNNKENDTLFSTTINFNKKSQIINYLKICEGDTLKINNKLIFKSDTFTYKVLNYLGCDSAISTIVNKISNSQFNQNITICEGQFYKLFNRIITKEGIYLDTFINYRGCDSIVTTKLNIIQKTYFIQNFSICFGDTLKIKNHKYSVSGTYLDTFKNYLGCDSIISTYLTVLPNSNSNQNIQLCFEDSLKIRNHIYSFSGSYLDTFKNYLGCDSFVTTNLTIIPQSKSNLIFEICQNDSVFYQSKIFTQAGFYPDTLSNYIGCDSIVNIIIYYNNLKYCEDAVIYIPNSFSPNNDVNNDVFKPIYKNVKNVNMRIFNRWGEIIFESNNPNLGWDGIYKDNLCQESVYLYLITIQGTNGKLYHFKGTVTLLK